MFSLLGIVVFLAVSVSVAILMRLGYRVGKTSVGYHGLRVMFPVVSIPAAFALWWTWGAFHPGHAIGSVAYFSWAAGAVRHHLALRKSSSSRGL